MEQGQNCSSSYDAVEGQPKVPEDEKPKKNLPGPGPEYMAELMAKMKKRASNQDNSSDNKKEQSKSPQEADPGATFDPNGIDALRVIKCEAIAAQQKQGSNLVSDELANRLLRRQENNETSSPESIDAQISRSRSKEINSESELALELKIKLQQQRKSIDTVAGHSQNHTIVTTPIPAKEDDPPAKPLPCNEKIRPIVPKKPKPSKGSPKNSGMISDFDMGMSEKMELDQGSSEDLIDEARNHCNTTNHQGIVVSEDENLASIPFEDEDSPLPPPPPNTEDTFDIDDEDQWRNWTCFSLGVLGNNEKVWIPTPSYAIDEDLPLPPPPPNFEGEESAEGGQMITSADITKKAEDCNNNVATNHEQLQNRSSSGAEIFIPSPPPPPPQPIVSEPRKIAVVRPFSKPHRDALLKEIREGVELKKVIHLEESEPKKSTSPIVNSWAQMIDKVTTFVDEEVKKASTGNKEQKQELCDIVRDEMIKRRHAIANADGDTDEDDSEWN